MYAELFIRSPLLLFPLVGLVCFIAVFTGAVVFAFRNRAVYERVQNLPLEEETNERR
jgi:cbb3-type cytochrome oxidase subunit 3